MRAAEPTPADAWIYRVEGDGERVAALVGRDVEAWPAGLAPPGPGGRIRSKAPPRFP